MPFAYPKKYDYDKTLSDHMPQVHDLGSFGSILTWNILHRCKLYQGLSTFYNNGYSYIETKEEYHLRLSSVIHELSEIIKRNKSINIINLQEIPYNDDLDYFINEFHTAFTRHLPDKNFEIKIFNIDQKKSNMVIFDSNVLDAENTTVEFNLNLFLKTQKKCFQHFIVTHQNTQKQLGLINVHLVWKEPNSEEYRTVVEDLQELLKHDYDFIKTEHNTVIAGDFNLNLNDLEADFNTPDIIIYAEPDTTLAYKYSSKEQVLETDDGFLIAHHVPFF